MAESITEGTLKAWTKQVGDTVEADEEVATIETDKVWSALTRYKHLFAYMLLRYQIDVSVNAPQAGKITELLASEEDTVTVGQDLFRIEPGEGGESCEHSPISMALLHTTDVFLASQPDAHDPESNPPPQPAENDGQPSETTPPADKTPEPTDDAKKAEATEKKEEKREEKKKEEKKPAPKAAEKPKPKEEPKPTPAAGSRNETRVRSMLPQK